MTSMLVGPLLLLLVLWSAYWVIRLAVRHGTTDALRARDEQPVAQPRRP